MLKAQLKMSRQCSVIMAASQKWHMELKICDWCLADNTQAWTATVRQPDRKRARPFPQSTWICRLTKLGAYSLLSAALCLARWERAGFQTGTQGCRLGGIAQTVVFTWHTRRQAIAMSDTGGDRWLGRDFFSWLDIHSKWQQRSLVSEVQCPQSNAWPLTSRVVSMADVGKK